MPFTVTPVAPVNVGEPTVRAISIRVPTVKLTVASFGIVISVATDVTNTFPASESESVSFERLITRRVATPENDPAAPAAPAAPC